MSVKHLIPQAKNIPYQPKTHIIVDGRVSNCPDYFFFGGERGGGEGEGGSFHTFAAVIAKFDSC